MEKQQTLMPSEKEIQELLDLWAKLSPEQKEVLLRLMQAFI